MDWSIVTVAAIGIIAPVVTTFMNNRHHIKLKKIELANRNYVDNLIHQRNLVEKFLEEINKDLSLDSYRYLNKLIPYITVEELENLKSLLDNSSVKDTDSLAAGLLKNPEYSVALNAIKRLANKEQLDKR